MRARPITPLGATHMALHADPRAPSGVGGGDAKPQVALSGVQVVLGTRWGLGFELFDWHGTEVIGHDGGTPGQSMLWRVITKYDFVVAININGGDIYGVLTDVLTPLVREVAGVVVPGLPTAPAPQRSVGRFVRLADDTFIAVEPHNGRFESVAFAEGGLFLHNGCAIPRIAG